MNELNVAAQGKVNPATMTARPDNDRLAELERENARLHRLVAELLLKNEKLRVTG